MHWIKYPHVNLYEEATTFNMFKLNYYLEQLRHFLTTDTFSNYQSFLNIFEIVSPYTQMSLMLSILYYMNVINCTLKCYLHVGSRYNCTCLLSIQKILKLMKFQLYLHLVRTTYFGYLSENEN
jgi:hypothetical protein